MKGYKPSDLFGCKIKVITPELPFTDEILMCKGFSIFDNDIVAINYDEWEKQHDISKFYMLEPLDQLDIEILDDSHRMSVVAGSSVAFQMLTDIMLGAELTDDYNSND